MAGGLAVPVFLAVVLAWPSLTPGFVVDHETCTVPHVWPGASHSTSGTPDPPDRNEPTSSVTAWFLTGDLEFQVVGIADEEAVLVGRVFGEGSGPSVIRPPSSITRRAQASASAHAVQINRR
jgi:hypothetical protein